MLFASSTASAGVRNVIATSTGPKISSCATVALGDTPVSSVGLKNKPFSGSVTSGCQHVAPSAMPVFTSAAMRSYCTWSTMAPMSTALSSGDPIRNVCMRARIFSNSRSATRSCTSNREPAQQTCPWLNHIPSTRPSTAESRSASSKTMNGLLPPSSSDSFFDVPAVALRIIRPTSVEPVNAILSMPGCSTIAAPVRPSPFTTFSTPLGSPISSAISANAIAVSGVYSAGLITTVQPAASAGATFHANISSGKFQGIICPTTPTGAYPTNSSSSNCAHPA